MKKYIITITPVLKNEPLPAIVLDVSTEGVSVNYPRDAGIQVNRLDLQSHSELCLKMPDDDMAFQLWYDDGNAGDRNNGRTVESRQTAKNPPVTSRQTYNTV